MAHGKAQGGALALGGSERVYAPAQAARPGHDDGTLIRRLDLAELEVGVEGLEDEDVGGAGLGDIGCELGEEVLELGGVRGNGHMRSVRVGGPVVEGGYVESVGADEADAIDDGPGGPGGRGDGAGRGAGVGHAVREHDDGPGVGGGRVEEGLSLLEGIAVVGAAAGGEGVHGGLEVCYGGRERGVCARRRGEADNGHPAAGAYLPGAGAARGLRDDVDKGLGPGLHIREGRAAQASGTVQDEHDVRGIRHDIGSGGEGEGHFERIAAADGGGIGNFVGIGHTHLVLPPSGDIPLHIYYALSPSPDIKKADPETGSA